MLLFIIVNLRSLEFTGLLRTTNQIIGKGFNHASDTVFTFALLCFYDCGDLSVFCWDSCPGIDGS